MRLSKMKVLSVFVIGLFIGAGVIPAILGGYNQDDQQFLDDLPEDTHDFFETDMLNNNYKLNNRSYDTFQYEDEYSNPLSSSYRMLENENELIPGEDFVTCEYIVKFKEDRDIEISEMRDEGISTGLPSIDMLNEKYQVNSVEQLFKNHDKTKDKNNYLTNIFKFEVSQETDVLRSIDEYSLDDNVIYAEPNYIYHTCKVPNDPDFDLQWALNQPNDHDIDAPEAWDIETGNENKDFEKVDCKRNCEIDMFSNQSKMCQENACISASENEHILISLHVCKDILTYDRQPTLFKWHATCPAADYIGYEWDFNGDGIVDFSKMGYAGQFLQTTYIYNTKGTYNATLKATVPYINISAFYDHVKITVKTGSGNQTFIEESENNVKFLEPRAADGITEKYAVMINGGYEDRFWIDVNFTYYMLINDYGYNSENIYLLNYNGSNPYGENPNDMIDYSCTFTNIGNVFSNLSQIIDEDDILFIWIDDHGMGYIGPNAVYPYFGFLYGYDAPFYDPGDEEDYLESDFKLRSFCVYGDFYEDMGMDIWKIQKRWNGVNNCYRCYREKYVSSFTDVYFENINNITSNDDVLIERFVDYLEGDYDQDGYIETDEGEVYDNDGDGIWPFDNDTGEINDEDDWGEIHHYDTITYLNTGVPQNRSENYMIFDDGFDNHVDIDLHYTGGELEVDGTDSDNQGLFDGIDINEDGDMDDWVSIDEQVCTLGDDLRDDILAMYLDNISAEAIPIFLEPCFCGGFIWDLSKFNRVICTATVEEDVSWGNVFLRGFTSAFHGSDIYGNPVDADTNDDGNISFVEAFNYASVNDYASEIPQYDDNGDGISHAHPIPNGSDGSLGLRTFLWGMEAIDIVYVDDDYTSSTPGWQYDHFDVIQDGIDAVAENGTVHVFNGTYYENVIVNKTIDLIGEDRDATVIDGGGNDIVICIHTNGVSITGFTITNSSGEVYFSGGINMWKRDYNHISRCIIRNNCHGINMDNSSHNEIIDTYFINNTEGIISRNGGDRGDISNYNTILNCNFSGNWFGMELTCWNFDMGNAEFQYNQMVNCSFYNSTSHGICIFGEEWDGYIGFKDNIFKGNTFKNNHNKGILMWFGSINNSFYLNSFINNGENVNTTTYNQNNQWDNGTFGNYWDDYIGVDSDDNGIGDIPYNISSSQQDHYPLMHPFGPPYAEFEYTIENKTVEFNASLSGDYDGTIVSYEWEFGDGENGTGIVVNHTYATNSTYNVTLTVTDDDGKNDSTFKNILIGPDTYPPEISNVQSYPSIQEQGEYVNVSCTITDITSVNATMINITFPDSVTINVSMINIPGTDNYFYNSTYSTSGKYDYFIWANDTSDNGNTSFIYSFEIKNLLADYTYSPVNPTTADTIIFTDNSIDVDGIIVNWTWDFDDGNISFEQNPTHDYMNPGNYIVCLNIKDDNGATDEICKMVSVVSVEICVDIDLEEGWNLITVPVHIPGLMASDLAENITGCVSINRWDAVEQTYKPYIVGGPPGLDFSVEDGYGYFIDVSEGSTLTLCGYPITTVDVPLKIGWNLIGWFHVYNTMASSLAENITGCVSINRWDAVEQTYKPFIVGGPPGLDFVITQGMGLFVDVSAESVWHGEG